MDDKEFRAIKARIAYKRYIEQLPKCDCCAECMFVNERKNTKRICKIKHEVIDTRVKTCPYWCPKREGDNFP